MFVGQSSFILEGRKVALAERRRHNDWLMWPYDLMFANYYNSKFAWRLTLSLDLFSCYLNSSAQRRLPGRFRSHSETIARSWRQRTGRFRSHSETIARSWRQRTGRFRSHSETIARSSRQRTGRFRSHSQKARPRRGSKTYVKLCSALHHSLILRGLSERYWRTLSSVCLFPGNQYVKEGCHHA